MRGKSCQLLGLIRGTCWFFTFLLHNQSLLLSTTFNPNGWQLDGIYIYSYWFSFRFLPKGGRQNEIVWIIGGGKHIFVCKACGKLGGSGGMLSREILIWTFY